MHSCDRAVLLDAGLEFHQDGMAATMAVKNLFTRQANLDRSIEHERSFGYDDFVIEGISLPTETAAVGRGNHPNMSGRHFQHLRKRAMEIMRSLRAGPNGQ